MYSNLFKVPLLFSRHAETPNNINPFHHMRDTNHTAVTRHTRSGRAQIRAHAEWYVDYVRAQGWEKLTFVISPYHRTQMIGLRTAKELRAALPKLNLTVITDDLLREHDSGFYRGRRALSNPRWEELRKQANQNKAYQFFINPGGESLANSTHRQEMLLMKYGLLYPQTGQSLGDALCLFGHGLSGRELFMLMRNESWEWFWQQKNLPNASVRLFNKGEDKGYLFIPPKAKATTPA